MTDQTETVAGRPRLLRSINEQNVLNAIRRAERLSRRDLTQLSNLSKPTVGLVLAGLTADGLVRVAGQRSGARGPSAALYEIDPDAGYALSLDVGFEYVRGAIADICGEVRARATRTVHAASTKSRTADLAALADSLIAEAGVSASAVLKTVVGCPGVHQPGGGAGGGHPAGTTDPAWHRPSGGAPAVSIGEVTRVLGPDAVIENDVNLAALAERDHGHGRGVDAFAFLTVGTGIGMGVVLDGTIHTGVRGAAGEIGYLPVRDDGGGVATLERVASAGGIVRAARRAGMRGAVSAPRVFAAARRGDERAVAVIDAGARRIAEALAGVVLAIDPALIVLGGGVGRAEGFADAVAAHLTEVVPVAPDVRVTAIGEEAVVDGGMAAALDLAWQKLLDQRS